MTTAERNRAQVLQGTALIILGVFYAVSSFAFYQSDSDQVECLRAVIDDRAGANAARARAVGMESQASRAVILGVLNATSRAEIKRREANYRQALRQVDRIRRNNPPTSFPPPGACRQ